MTAARFPRVFVFVCALAVPLSADAAETGGCETFAWPLATELQWLKASDSEALTSGASPAETVGERLNGADAARRKIAAVGEKV